jgi:hypothetical protein
VGFAWGCLTRFKEVEPGADLIVNLPQKCVPNFAVVRRLTEAGPKETAFLPTR